MNTQVELHPANLAMSARGIAIDRIIKGLDLKYFVSQFDFI
jgi:hypothetical protein